MIVFPNVYQDAEELLKPDTIVEISGKITVSTQNGIELLAERIARYQPDESFFAGKQIYVKIAKDRGCSVDGLMNITKRYPGNSSLGVYVEKTGQKYKLCGSRSVCYQAKFLEELKDYLGEENVIVK